MFSGTIASLDAERGPNRRSFPLGDRDLQRLLFFSWRRASDVASRAEGVEKDFPEICANDGVLGRRIHSAGVKSDIRDAITSVL